MGLKMDIVFADEINIILYSRQQIDIFDTLKIEESIMGARW